MRDLIQLMLPYWWGEEGGNYYLTTDITDFTHKDAAFMYIGGGSKTSRYKR